MGFLGDLIKEVVDTGKDELKSELKSEIRSGTRDAVHDVVDGAKQAIGSAKDNIVKSTVDKEGDAQEGAAQETATQQVAAQETPVQETVVQQTPVQAINQETSAQAITQEATVQGVGQEQAPQVTSNTSVNNGAGLENTVNLINGLMKAGEDGVEDAKSFDESIRRNVDSSATPIEAAEKTKQELSGKLHIDQLAQNIGDASLRDLEEGAAEMATQTTKSINNEATALAGNNAITQDDLKKLLDQTLSGEEKEDFDKIKDQLDDNPFVNGVLAAINLSAAEKNGVDLKEIAKNSGLNNSGQQ